MAVIILIALLLLAGGSALTVHKADKNSLAHAAAFLVLSLFMVVAHLIWILISDVATACGTFYQSAHLWKEAHA